MNRLCINKVLEEMNSLQRLSDKYADRAYDLGQEGKYAQSDRYDRKSDMIDLRIKGIEFTLRTLGLGVWRTREGEWVIPTDDIIRAT